jgi:hypothetical protein
MIPPSSWTGSLHGKLKVDRDKLDWVLPGTRSASISCVTLLEQQSNLRTVPQQLCWDYLTGYKIPGRTSNCQDVVS